jgi:hypothetical protein
MPVAVSLISSTTQLPSLDIHRTPPRIGERARQDKKDSAGRVRG